MEAGTPELVKLEDLQVGSGLTGRKHLISLLVENKPGVLARIAGLFARRGFNIDTLAVGPTEDPDISRITLTLDGAVHPIDQVTKQLHKLVNVIKIRDMEPDQTISREMALFRVQASVESRAEIVQFAEIFRAKIVDVSRRALTIEVTGSNEKIDAFERMVRPHGLIEMARTGEVAITRSRPGPVGPPCSRRPPPSSPWRRCWRRRGGGDGWSASPFRWSSRTRAERCSPLGSRAIAGSAGSSRIAKGSRSRRSAARTRWCRVARGASATSSPPARR